jgi:hypothetical protein
MQRHFRITRATVSQPERLPANQGPSACLPQGHLPACQLEQLPVNQSARLPACLPAKLPRHSASDIVIQQAISSLSNPYRHSASYRYSAQSHSASYSVIQHVTKIFRSFRVCRSVCTWRILGIFRSFRVHLKHILETFRFESASSGG